MNLKNTPYGKPGFREKLYWRQMVEIGQLPIVDGLCSWTDICGLGSKLAYAGFDLRRLMGTVYCNIPKQLQMNTAFARSYMIESAGSNQGIKPNGFYIDKSVVDLLTSRLNETETDVTGGEIRIINQGLDALTLEIIEEMHFEHQFYKTIVYRLVKAIVGLGLECESVSFDVSDIGVDQFDEPGVLAEKS